MAYLARGRFRELEAALAVQVRAAQESDPLQRVTIVVGSALVRAHLVRALAQRLGACANVEVVTLYRLAALLAGRTAGDPLSRLAQERLVARLVAARAPRGPWYFTPVAGTPGLGRALLATIEDLREGLVVPGSVAGAASGAGAAKCRDLAELYDDYLDALQDAGLADEPAVYGVATKVAQAASGLDDGVFMLYGFYDLPQMQADLVGAVGAERSLGVFVPEPACGATFSAWSRQFLVGLAEEERVLSPPTEASTLSWLCRRLFAPVAEEGPAPAADGTLRILSVADDAAEATEAARQLITAAASGTPLWDMAVIVANRDAGVTVATSLRRLGLPVATRLPDLGRTRRVLELVLDCVAPAAGPALARRAVIDLAAVAVAGDAAVPAAEQARWSDESRRANVVGGAEQWRDRLARRCRHYESRLRELEGGDDEAGDDPTSEAAAARAGLAAVRSLEQFVERLASVSAALPASASWAEQAETFCAAVMDLAMVPESDEPLVEIRGLRDLDRVSAAATFAEFAATVRRLVADRREPCGSVGRDGVAVLTVEEVRGLSFHTVVFCGLSEGGFPPRPTQDPVLLDDERRAINLRVGAHLPVKSEREDESRVLFALALETARTRAVLISLVWTRRRVGRGSLRGSCCTSAMCWPAAPSPSQSWMPRTSWVASGVAFQGRRWSSMADRVRAVASWPPRSHRPACLWTCVSSTWRRSWPTGPQKAVDGVMRARAVLRICARSGVRIVPSAVGAVGAVSSPRRSVRGTVCSRAARRSRLCVSSTRSRGRTRRPGCKRSWTARSPITSSTSSCTMRPPDEPTEAAEIERETSSARWRTTSCSRCSRELTAGGFSPAEALAVLRRVTAERCRRAEDEGVTGLPLAWQARRRMLVDDLGTAVRLDLEGWRATTASRGSSSGRSGPWVERPVWRSPDGRRMELRGRIDRLDRSSDGARVRLIDYKTGRGEAERQSLRGGRNAQLAAYVLAAQQVLQPPPEQVVSEFRFVTRRGAFRTLSPAEDSAAVTATFAALVARVVAAIEAGLFVRTAEGQRCRYCDVAYACGVGDWARRRKRGDDVLVPIRELQRGDLRETAADA